MIGDSARHLKEAGRTVFLDAEHFFDGLEANRNYALQCLKTAATAGVDCVVLCDTNGGTITSRISDIVRAVVKEVPCEVGIHTHNGADVAVAGSLAAIEAGRTPGAGRRDGLRDMRGTAAPLSGTP